MINPASQTAIGPMTIVAAEQYQAAAQRLSHDTLAYRFLPANIQSIVRLTRWRPARNLLINLTEKTAHGIWGSVLCRKRYIEDKLRAAAATIDAVVILGAGLDTLAYRIVELRATPVFEVDLPENITYKRTMLQKLYGEVPANVRLVPIDFERQDLETVLAEHGYQSALRTFFVWEAVSQYLTEEAVRTTFTFLAKAATGSCLGFTYIRQDFLDGVNLYGAAPTYQRFRVKQRLWHFGMAPEQVAAFLEPYGWQELEQMGSREFTARYILPSGRDIPGSEMERAVYAERIEVDKA